MKDALSLVEAVEERLRPVRKALSLAWWDLNVDATDENARRRVEADLAYSDVLADRELFSAIADARARDGATLVRRRLDLIHDLMLRHQIPDALRKRVAELEASVEATFSRHRGVVGGREADDNEIKRILRESDDPHERREAWEASKTVGAAVADDVRELVRLRNEAARSVGFRDWYALSLATDEMDEVKLAETMSEADRVTAEPFACWKRGLDARLADRFACSPDDLRPWHYADPFFQDVPSDGGVELDPLFEGDDIVSLAARTFEGMGFEVQGILERSDLYPRPGKCQHAFCIDVDRAGDVRVLANVVANHSWAETMLHELGHGVFDLGFGESLPWLLRDTHLVTTEATAILFGTLAGQHAWLRDVLGADRREVDDVEDRLRASRVAELLVFTRWALVMNGFERALYAAPDGDLDSLWWELVRRHQGVAPPADRSASDWAAKIHVATAPVYYHTYLYGSIVALQLRDALDQAAGGLVDRPQAGRILAERLFAPGQSVRWDRLVEQVSGAPFSVAALEREVAQA